MNLLRALPTRILPLALAASLLLSACGTQVVNPVTGEMERTVMDEPAELAEGQKGHKQVLTEYGVYDNPRVQAYVNAVGQKLAQQSHRAQLSWTFTVLDSTEINAFALPGGYVYITRGLMAYLDSEAELAGVLGHEISHVTARHGAQRATRQQTAGFGVLAATLLGAVLEGYGLSGATDIASQASQVAAAGYIATYSREQESQADELGAAYLARNQYDPRNMIDVIRVLKDQERFAAETAKAEGKPAPSGANWLSSHPSNDQRLADLQQLATTYQAQAHYLDDGHAPYLKVIDGMTFGDGRAQGVVRGPHFFHEGLGIALTAPAGWRIRNGAEAITLVNEAGDAGLIVRLLPAKAGSTHEELIRQVIQPVSGRVVRRSLHGLNATHFSGKVRNKQGQEQAIQATVVTGPGGQNYLLQYAAKSDEAMQGAAAQMAEAEASFRALSAAERTAARPWQLKAVPYPRGGFEELARATPLPARAQAQLQLLNGVYGGSGTAPRLGQTVKTVY